MFFGRGHQIRELYDRLTAPRTAPIMLFYGQSGVGKSSILDAGLIPRLEQDYAVRYLRRAAGGLLDTLQLAFLPEASDLPIETAWRLKEEKTGKPLILFLDQVEELYTRPVADLPDELDQLLKVINITFVQSGRRPLSKLVLGFRKEWLAELESQLIDYELPRTRVFLEPLNRRGIIEVVRGPARSEQLRGRYGLTVEDGLPEIIADDLLEDRGSAIAPILQILLTKMWTKATETNYEHPHFSQDLYQTFKRDGILLRDFLNQQIAAFRQRYPEAVDSGLLLDILAMHTTPLGTADQCSIGELQQQYAHQGTSLPDLLQHCQDLYLLTVAASTQKESTKTMRLAHDTLAPLVREQFDVSDKPGQRARRILDNRSIDWEEGSSGTPLDEADLAIVEHGVAGTRALNGTEQRLLEASSELRARLQRNRRIRKIIGAAAVVVIASLGAFGWYSNAQATAKNKELDKEKKRVYLQLSDLEFLHGTIARNTNSVIRAGHHHLRAAKFAQLGEDEQWKKSALIAALSDSGFVEATCLHEDRVEGGLFSKDESRVLTWSWDQTARLWDAASGKSIQTFTHEDHVSGGFVQHGRLARPHLEFRQYCAVVGRGQRPDYPDLHTRRLRQGRFVQRGRVARPHLE